jgi:hypothetical protein
MILPVRFWKVVAAPAVDSPPEDQVEKFTYRTEALADAFLRAIAVGKASGQLSPDDMNLEYFVVTVDADVDVPVTGLADAIAQGYAVISAVVPVASYPVAGQLGVIVGGASITG